MAKTPFKMKSGNKVSFKNMGSSPGKQLTGPNQERKWVDGDFKIVDIPSRIWKDGELVTNPKYKRGIGEVFIPTGNTSDEDVDKYKTSEEIAAGDKKSEMGFDFTEALKSFLSSGGGKEGLLKGIGAGITKKSPNEILAKGEEYDAKKAHPTNYNADGTPKTWDDFMKEQEGTELVSKEGAKK